MGGWTARCISQVRREEAIFTTNVSFDRLRIGCTLTVPKLFHGQYTALSNATASVDVDHGVRVCVALI